LNARRRCNAPPGVFIRAPDDALVTRRTACVSALLRAVGLGTETAAVRTTWVCLGLLFAPDLILDSASAVFWLCSGTFFCVFHAFSLFGEIHPPRALQAHLGLSSKQRHR
jgi:hypothetical protein